MNDTTAGLLQASALVGALAVVHRPFGDYLARVYASPRHLRVERWMYRVVGVDPDAEQRWDTYLRAVLAFSLVSILGLYALLRLQDRLPLSLGRAPIPPDQAFNTAVSFVTNTNWQSYSGEQVMGHLAQMAGLAVQNFVSAAVGMAVAVALVRGFARTRTDRLGNFWVDLVRGCVRVLLPIAVVGALLLIAGGVVQNLAEPQTVRTLAGGEQTIPGGPVASQEVIKELGTNGGGFYNANSAHPFENPNPVTNWVEIFLMLLIPSSLPRAFGRLVGDTRQGYAILAAMAVLYLGALTAMTAAELAHPGAVPQAAGAAMEGKETRFGIFGSTLFGTTSTATSTGAVNSMHDSYTALGGGVALLNMMLGEVSPGGVGSGLYGMLVLAVVAVFVAGLMAGRTPEYLGKKIRAREMKLVALYILVVPAVILVGTGLALALGTGRSSILNPGAHGLSEVLYAFTSAANNNGSAFAGLNADTPFYNIGLGLAMLAGRFLPITLVLALAGSLAAQQPVAATSGTLSTHRSLFVGLLAGVTLIVAGLTFFPALALGPLAEGVS
ncbi:potassium-transporting ATPase subunit KdpA [Carbonactinospora thermoautotrophica]|uniref:potassium-transporting ATPase subunit KdpA n=1 Tax=Carbonactinospora thermoautotrophica TaxID=1469144 RepID=UPI00226F4430|nr:potassium-transporting ATPase subunit KdpA [Carbonactinospora thermoautotrophica]MCX9190734.1 potassium-transporting ATPase subunit KdpA [Carbonactinospora thermoautotrophica]